MGARCPSCARLYKLPTFQVAARHYLKASGAALGMAIACGLVWGLITGLFHLFYLNFLIAAGVGYAIGEVVSISVNRKRAASLAVVAGLGVALSYLVSLFPPWSPALARLDLRFLVIDLLALALGIFVAVTRLR